MQNFDYDVVVIGAGPAGFGAAVASARQGARTALVEQYGFCGGMATAAGVSVYANYRAGTRNVACNIFNDFTSRLILAGAAYQAVNAWVMTNPEDVKYYSDLMLLEAKADIFYHCRLSHVNSSGNAIDSVTVIGKSGDQYKFTAKVFIDATGDAETACQAGAQLQPLQGPLSCQPMSMICTLGPVDLKSASLAGANLVDSKYLFWGNGDDSLNRIVEIAKSRGDWKIPRDSLAMLWSDPRCPEMISINGTRISNYTGCDSRSLSLAEIEGRRQVRLVLEFVNKYLPGFEKAGLVKTAAQVGVRETRRILGRYQLNEEDVLQCRHFPDEIAISAYPIDVHNSNSHGADLRDLPHGRCYGIPYGCLLSSLNNLLVAGRAISATHNAAGSTRVMSVCMSTGEAAGTAAALACMTECSVENIDINTLRTKLALDNIQ
jgi:hypothetical protein